MVSALSPLYDAVYGVLRDGARPNAALRALGVTYVGDRPGSARPPYVLFTGDTESENTAWADAGGTPSEDTISLTVWAPDDYTTRAIAAEIVAALSEPIALPDAPSGVGFGMIRAGLDLNTRLPARPEEPQGRALRFRYTIQPT